MAIGGVLAGSIVLDWPSALALIFPQIVPSVVAIILAVKTPVPRPPGTQTRSTDVSTNLPTAGGPPPSP